MNIDQQKIWDAITEIKHCTILHKVRRLNSLGIRTVTGKPWTGSNLAAFCYKWRKQLAKNQMNRLDEKPPVFRSIPDPQSRSVVIKLVEDSALTDKQKIHMLRAYLSS